ncbi:MAG: tRNA (adenosine(37)-N6)-threonylcarbamoyltransferase complex ATPase subunit type 1 TsaE [Pseudomonadota bacterium]
MTETSHYHSDGPADTDQIGEQIAAQIRFPSCIYLVGEMAAGKTTLCKSIIRSLGVSETVTSPTYNLVHEYPAGQHTIYHLDLYRLNDPEELSYLALADLWTENSLFLVEWPDRGTGYLPPATHIIELQKGVDKTSESREIRYSAC